MGNSLALCATMSGICWPQLESEFPSSTNVCSGRLDVGEGRRILANECYIDAPPTERLTSSLRKLGASSITIQVFLVGIINKRRNEAWRSSMHKTCWGENTEPGWLTVVTRSQPSRKSARGALWQDGRLPLPGSGPVPMKKVLASIGWWALLNLGPQSA